MKKNKNIILGTAGHIDHGKTAFIRALTGIDCDRLKEEKERGITIVLGYAHMMLPSGIKVGIVDVPGHERFVSKMVAGASGIDVVAFLVAADDGIKPQTIEHLHICDILGITRGIVVLSKKDLVDEELLFLQKEEIKVLLKGTGLEGSPIIPVSSVSGDGLADFILTLDKIAGEVTTKSYDKPFRLPVDATLTITGFGTVVRGTALSGTITVGEEVTILPEGRKTRIRGIENHGSAVRDGFAGERLALNLSDVSRDEVDRGVVIARHGYYRPSDTFLVHFKYLPYNKKPIMGKLHCQFHVLTSRVRAELLLLHMERLHPGEACFAVVKTSRPLIVSYGDSFVIRGYGLFTTIGGGRILNPVLPEVKENYTSPAYLHTLRQGSLADKITFFILHSGEKGMSLKGLAGVLNESDDDIKILADKLKKSKIIFQDDGYVFYHKEHVYALKEKLSGIVHGYHQQNPLRAGINKEELFVKAGTKADLFHLALHLMIQEGIVQNDRDLIRERRFNLTETFADPLLLKVEELFFAYGLQPKVPAEAAKELKMDQKLLTKVLNLLIRSERMFKINEDFYLHAKHWERIQDMLSVYFKNNLILTPQDARGLFGLPRKFSIPLLEFLDYKKMTVRTMEGRRWRKEGAT
ncbi:MAG: selenocysteine-specific translation elongation factor [Deltaproteobacteria bacterium HGW-Deltaproteobacteria-9]|nr:MAG: selenocysteine-specific translation elongation factor [Deltaproteobacteria bacterium HGW-Deltaproteobacteria-9]